MSVPLYFHIPVVLGLLTAQGLTVRWALRKIRDLQAALLAKKVLLGESAFKAVGAHIQTLAPDETLTLEGPGGDWFVEIKARSTTTLEVRSVQVR